MASEFEFLGPNDKPALLGLSTPELLSASKSSLQELGYKVHATENHEEFLSRFGLVQYQVVVLEEHFATPGGGENVALTRIQNMPMSQRRHATFILFGAGFESMHGMQAYHQSMHAVINPSDVGSVRKIFQQTISDSELLMQVYRDTQARIAQGKL